MVNTFFLNQLHCPCLNPKILAESHWKIIFCRIYCLADYLPKIRINNTKNIDKMCISLLIDINVNSYVSIVAREIIFFDISYLQRNVTSFALSIHLNWSWKSNMVSIDPSDAPLNPNKLRINFKSHWIGWQISIIHCDQIRTFWPSSNIYH